MLLNQGMLAQRMISIWPFGVLEPANAIFRVLGSLRGDAAGLSSLEAAYQSKYGDLVADLRSDLTADEYARVREIISPAILEADVQDCGTGSPAQTTRSVREAHARAVVLRLARGRLVNSSVPAVQAAPSATSRSHSRWGPATGATGPRAAGVGDHGGSRDRGRLRVRASAEIHPRLLYLWQRRSHNPQYPSLSCLVDVLL